MGGVLIKITEKGRGKRGKKRRNELAKKESTRSRPGHLLEKEIYHTVRNKHGVERGKKCYKQGEIRHKKKR